MRAETVTAGVLIRKQRVGSLSLEFFSVVKLVSMMVLILVGVPVAAALCFRLLLPLFTVDMPCRHVESGPSA